MSEGARSPAALAPRDGEGGAPGPLGHRAHGQVGRAAPGRAGTPQRASGTPGRVGRGAPLFRAVGFWLRLLAALLDAVIVVPIALALAWIVGRITGFGMPPNLGLDYWLDLLLGNDPSMVALAVILIATSSIYLFVFQTILGRTLAMQLLRVRVIDVYGDSPTAGRAALRTIGSLASLATLGLGFLWIGFDSEKRGLQDWIASTYVVKA